jgi:thiosulfate dehydrogenase [quinone] large subunit
MPNTSHEAVVIPEPKLAKFLFADTRIAWVWLLLRVYVGYEWIMASLEKIASPMWVGPQAGVALRAFLQAAVNTKACPCSTASWWYAIFINNVALPHVMAFSYLIAFGEFAAGLGLVLGAFTGIAAFFGAFMNLNYLFAGTVSINPLFLLLQLFLILAWRNAGWLGLDRWLLPWLGVPWQPGKIAK